MTTTEAAYADTPLFDELVAKYDITYKGPFPAPDFAEVDAS